MKSPSFVFLIGVCFLAACSSQPIMPETEEIKVVRHKPKGCKKLEKVVGRTMYASEGENKAVENLKKNAADKGATHVHIKKFSGTRTSVTGWAYQCD